MYRYFVDPLKDSFMLGREFLTSELQNAFSNNKKKIAEEFDKLYPKLLKRFPDIFLSE